MQLDLFKTHQHDSAIYDVFDLLDIAPFSLARAAAFGPQYMLKDATIAIECGDECGVASVWDYDLVIALISHLMKATRQSFDDAGRGGKALTPPTIYRSTATDVLKFCCRELGGNQYVDLEFALDRLQRTRFTITQLKARSTKRRDIPSTALIGSYRVISRTLHGRIDQFEIDIPEWIHDRVVRGESEVVPLSREYFLLQPISRFIYRLARKTDGKRVACYPISDLYVRSGARTPKHKFWNTVEAIVRSHGPINPFPDYDLTLQDSDRERMLIVRPR